MATGGNGQLRRTDGALQLFDHWERHQWTIRGSQPAQDRPGWQALPPPVRDQLRTYMIEFFIAEFSVVETLAPLAQGAPDKDAQLFLCTQLADEARHSLFFYRYLEMVDGAGFSPESKLESAWLEASQGQIELFDKQLHALTDRVRLDLADRAAWYEAITLYHFVLEGVLATSGQRVMLRLAKYFNELAVLTEGLTSVSRDEARHVAFGVHALRQGVADRYADNILGVINESIDPLVEMVVQPKRAVPMLQHESGIEYTVYGWEITRRTLEKRLKAIGLLDCAADVDARWREAFIGVLDEYEATHGCPHPAREHWLEAARV